MRKGRKKNRLVFIGLIGVVLFAAVGLVLFALNDQITLFKSPSDIAREGMTPGQKIRIGGLVQEGSWERTGTDHQFTVTDTENTIKVRYTGIVPDLFREGQGVVLDGAADAAGTFVATTVLAKHDENYVPKEVVDALKDQGVWKDPSDALN
ncbi:MAG: cytochrome c maturation protein CcmE [Pseudomonadota bacterium]